MRFSQVALGGLEYALPPEVWTSARIEAELAPLYARLRLPAGRLELMTGIRERRFWPMEHLPSAAAAEAGEKVLTASGFDREQLDLLIHCGVCRDRLEPATAAYVHGRLGLPGRVQILDVSNACLGFLNGLVLSAGLIESGQIRSALLVSGENGRPLLENTLARLNRGDLDRQAIKPYFANLTIGGGAIAGLVCHRDLAPAAPVLLGGAVQTETSHNNLCQGNTAQEGSGLEMLTDAEALLEAGLDLADRTWREFLGVLQWTASSPGLVVTHQVGRAHRTGLFTRLGLDPGKDFSTFETLGNVGSVSLPITLRMAAEAGRTAAGMEVALLGIGSGLSCMMLGLRW